LGMGVQGYEEGQQEDKLFHKQFLGATI
jgi:hypothetical protein